LPPDEAKARTTAFTDTLAAAITQHGYPASADPAQINRPMTVLLLWILVIYVTLVYAPIAAWLVELFPTRIRYTGMSLPYHIGNGWFGGLLPATVFAISAQQGNIYAGLWYPIIIAAATVVIGAIFVPGGTQSRSMFTDDPQHKVHH
ncbi:MAG TPA: MFS transporter, partial [Rubellimicrobium sp.]|nr:MFS transporter [Rubellimicrobium sp.]